MDSCSATVGAVPSLSTISSSAQASAMKNDPLKENLVKPTSENVVLSSSERGSVQPSLFLEVSTKKKLPWRAYRETKRTQARESTEALKMNSQIDIPSGSNSEKIASRTTKSRKSTKKNPPFHFNPNAEPFVPRTTSFQERKNLKEKKHRTRKKYISLKDRLVRELENCTYECAICYQRITSKQGTWSCDTCYHIFHISHGCIIDWAKSSREDDNKWRCPTCQTKYERMPYNYFCFCGKQKNPTFELGSTPHTCDGVCEKKRGPDCPHPCTDRCHPGPCNECPLQVVRTCNCGAEEKTVRCGSKIVMKCEKVCGKMLKCGNHRCTNVCHSGDCDSCNERVFQVCYCGKENREVSCGNDPQTSFSCKSPCRGTYSCGIHKCERRCHEKWDNGCGDCPMSAAKVTHCPCGKKSLDELKVVRSECTDAIPTCEAVCGKILECGSKGRNHRCAEKCHAGPCPPCLCGTGVTCRCGNKKTIISCLEFVEIYKSGNQPYLCEKRCRKKKSCGIHKCQEDCCVQDEHFFVCKFATNVFHVGTIIVITFVMQGNVHAASTQALMNSIVIVVERFDLLQCAHPVTHNCHGEERCPPCTFLTEKYCYGKHVLRKNIPCHIEAVSCGMECGLELSCGVHNCNRKCHSAPCEQVQTPSL
ncbi:unnamed protein product [Caenorhabditis auriculariae]|uniref:RING-type domain-containing protein n=1 Tax=Caenorhabditis auriculariae TaxID=2777116 RepID=A0A8S1GYT2_9PELO|nr:unnamed protein product [Caenorhabditis auriculariae]